MKMRIKRIMAGCLSVALTLSLLLGGTTASKANAAEGEADSYSHGGTMNILSRRVTKPELYGDVPEEQKSVSGENPVAVVNEELKVDISGDDIIDYIRFYGESETPAQRKGDAGEEKIGFSSQQSSVAAVEDWTNLPVSIEGGEASVTATNFKGEGATLTFTVPTVAGEERTLTIYAGGNPNTGTITALARMGEETIPAVAGNTTAASYAFSPNSSQVTEYALEYTGTGQDLVVTLSLSGTGNVPWAGISVAAAVLKNTGGGVFSPDGDNAETITGEVPDAGNARMMAAAAKAPMPAAATAPELVVVERVINTSGNFAGAPADQKVVSDANPVALEDKVLSRDFTSGNVIDYVRFTGNLDPARKADVTEERLEFSATSSDVVAVTDWINLPITYGNGTSDTLATSFRGNGSAEFTVQTVAGTERILDIFIGGHPSAAGVYTTSATLGGTPIKIKAGSKTLDEYVVQPNCSQIFHYQVKYTGTGEELKVKMSLTNAGAAWASIAIAGAVLRDDISHITPQKGSFNKSTSDVEYRDLSTTITPKNASISFQAVSLKGTELNANNYTYDAGTSVLTLKTSYLESLAEGSHVFKVRLSNGEELSYTVEVSDAGNTPRPYVKETGTLSNPDLNAWTLWYQDEFDEKLDDWWEPSYLKWWNYSSESNEKYNTIMYDPAAGSSVLKQSTTENMRTDSIMTRRDNFRNPGITLGVRDLIHNYRRSNLTNYQHMATDDRGATAYGYFEIRAKITGGTTAKTQSGSSAWWFTGFQDASWQTMEVDMVEYGYGVAESALNAHFASPMHAWRDNISGAPGSYWNSTDKGLGVDKPADDYHVYGYEWTPTGMNGYFDGVQVWHKNTSVNYRMLMWISLNAHAFETYTTDAKAHYIDYVRVWKTPELVELEKQLVTKNVIQKQAPKEGNVATLAYAGANGLRSNHYQKYDPGYINDGDTSTSYRATTKAERADTTYPGTPYESGEQYLYLDWVEYTQEEIKNASDQRETITDLRGDNYTFASEQEVRSPKKVAAVEIVVNKNAATKTFNKNNSDNSKGYFAYDVNTETANLFPYKYDIEYSEDGYNGWLPIATDVTAQWSFDGNNVASFITNVSPVSDVNHLRIHVKSVWNSDTNQEVSTDNGFYVAELKVYETPQANGSAASAGGYSYNHAVDAEKFVTDKNGNEGSWDTNFPVCDVADGVYVNEFRSSGDGTRLANNANRVDTSIENVPDFPQYINFQWNSPRTIDSLGFNIGYMASAPTSFELQVLKDGTWKTVQTVNDETWTSDFQKKIYTFDAETTSQARVAIIKANKGPKLEYNGGIEGDGRRIVRIAAGYYSIAEIELLASNVKVTLDANGGTVADDSVILAYNDTYAGLPTPTRTDYIFKGWYTAAAGGTLVDGNTAVTDRNDHTLYAHWEVIPSYTVTYKADGKTVGTPQTVKQGGNAVPEQIPHKDGYDQTAPSWDHDGKNITADTVINAVYVINTYAVSIPANQEGYEITADASRVDYGRDVTLTYKLKEGYTETESFAVKVNQTPVTLTNGRYTISNVKEDITVTVEGVLDKTAPTAEIRLGTHRWNSFLNTITLGLFFKDTQSVTITAEDTGSLVNKIYYYLADGQMSLDQVKAITDWTEYKNSFSIHQDKEYVIYAKATDNSGNVCYVSSDGLVMDTIAPVIEGIENGKTYCTPVEVTVIDKYLNTIKVNGAEIAVTDGKLTLSPAKDAQTIAVTDKAGNETVYTVTVNDGHDFKDGSCTVCGQPDTDFKPIITAGVNGTWKPDSGADLSFTSNAAFADFIKVQIDGQDLDPQYYDVREGSTIVTLKDSYLKTLSVGEHTIAIVSVTGTASTIFKVEAVANPPENQNPDGGGSGTDNKTPDGGSSTDNKNPSGGGSTDNKNPSGGGSKTTPKTGDNSQMTLWMALLCASGLALAKAAASKRKRI